MMRISQLIHELMLRLATRNGCSRMVARGDSARPRVLPARMLAWPTGEDQPASRGLCRSRSRTLSRLVCVGLAFAGAAAFTVFEVLPGPSGLPRRPDPAAEAVSGRGLAEGAHLVIPPPGHGRFLSAASRAVRQAPVALAAAVAATANGAGASAAGSGILTLHGISS